jgi:ferric-dicitrate binding protein FerR (iron transport regulator)
MSFLRRVSLGLALLSATSSLALAAPVAQVIKLSGAAELKRGNATAPLQLGTALELGDQLTTTDNGRVRLQLLDGSTINLGSGSALLIDDLVSGGPGTERQIELELEKGSLKAEAAPATPKSRFEIRTPLAVTAVRGTVWGIVAQPQQSDVIIIEGRVGIRRNIFTGETGISLTRNHGLSVTADALGQMRRWSPEEIAAFEALTNVPGTEIPFNPNAAPAPALVPIVLPPSEKKPGSKKKICLDEDSLNCRIGGRNNSSDSGGHEGGKDNGHDHDNGNSF